MGVKQTASENSLAKVNLFLLLKSFTKEEFKEFRKFVHSPLHNNRSEVTDFFEVIKKFYPKFSHVKFSKENIFAELYPRKKYKDDVIRRLTSNLFKAAEEYCAYKNFKSDRFDFEKNLLEYLFHKRIDKLFWKQFNAAEKYLEEQPLRDSEYFRRQSLINDIEMMYILKDDPLYKKSSYEKELQNHWKYTLTSMMRLYGFAEYETYFFNKNYELRHAEHLLTLAEDLDYLGSETVKIYYLILKLYRKDRNDELLYTLLNLIEKNTNKFSRGEVFSFYVHLFNYCNINKLEHDSDYTKIEFEISKKLVEKKLLIQDGVVDPGWFRGIFFKAFNAGEIDFAEEFIEQHKSLIIGNDKENIIRHAYANIAVFRKDYGKALEHLSHATYQHLNDKWLVKQMYLKIYFEQNDFEKFSYITDSMKHLIKEEGLWNEHLIVPIRNFINFLTKVFRAKLKEIEISPEALKNEILHSKIIARKWLLEKIDEL
ncbi:MAG: hypothetical protein K1X86_08300 [Ignavibacteria bacterium]|nr:hypothetical protein [Ignavibacteria bacterium]